MRLWPRRRAHSGVNFVNFVGFRDAMKPINVFPLIMLLIALLFLVYWLRPHG